MQHAGVGVFRSFSGDPLFHRRWAWTTAFPVLADSLPRHPGELLILASQAIALAIAGGGRPGERGAHRARQRAGSRGREFGKLLTDEQTHDAIVRARAGDDDAFGELLKAHEARVAAICRRMLGSHDAALDAVSEVFLRAGRSLPTYDLERPFGAWLTGIAGNHCIDLLRHRASEQRVFADIEASDADLHKLATEGHHATALSRLVAAEQKDSLEHAIESLPVRYRLPLMLRYFGDHDYATIAEMIGVTTGQVGSLLFRAKRMLRERVSESDRADG